MHNDDDTDDNALALAPYSDEVWQEIFRYLGTEDEPVSYASKQLLRAWRAGVVGLCLHLPSPLFNANFLGHQGIRTFPHLTFIHVDSGRRFTKTKAPSPVGSQALVGAQLGLGLHLSLSLNLSTPTEQQEAYRLLRQHPHLARRVTCLSMNDHPAYAAQRRLVAQGLADGGPQHLSNLWQLVALLPHLMALDIAHFDDFSDGALAALGTSPHLTHLKIRHARHFSDATLGKLGGLTALKCLKVCDASQSLTGAGLQGLLAGAAGLESLFISGLDRHFNSDHLHCLATAQALRELTLIARGLDRLDSIEISDPSQLRPLSACTSLRSLMLINASFSEACLRAFGTLLAQLEVLELAFCEDFTADTLPHLQALTGLKRLSLLSHDHVFTLDAIAAFASAMPALTHIGIAHDRGDDDEAVFRVLNGHGDPVDITPPGLQFF